MTRTRLLLFIFFLAWIILVFRLSFWQIGNFEKFVFEAKFQHQTKKEVTSPRGIIYASDNFPLALSKQTYLLYIQPNLVKDANEVYEKISKTLSLEKEKFFKIAEDKKIYWYPLKKQIESLEKDNLEKEKIVGIGFEPQWQRVYPEASMAAHLLGFVGFDEAGKQKGYFGLEGFYDRELRGTSGERLWEKDLLGRPIIIGAGSEKKARRGRDLYLTLDRRIQFLVEEELKKGIEKYKAQTGSVVILDPHTGGVLAMASFPSFDLLNYADEDKINFLNPIISMGFEPGSIFKPIVMAAAIDMGLVNPQTTCPICFGPVRIGEYTIKTWNDKYYPSSTMVEVIQNSDNVGMVFVAQKLGYKNLLRYLSDFGFGRKTGIDLEGEQAPVLKEGSFWSEIDLATVGFGQGIAVTPIQMVRAMAAISNGGRLVTPRVVEKIKDGEKTIPLKRNNSPQIIKPITAKVVTEMLINAVEKGEGKWAKPKGYKIAGKTGTAQIPVAGHYDVGKTIASFIGFAPADNPKFVMLVTLREPKTSPWGSETAAPLWFEIAKGIFRIWGIPPG